MMEQVQKLSHLDGKFIVTFCGDGWEKQAREWSAKRGIKLGKYYKQLVGKCVIFSYNETETEEK